MHHIFSDAFSRHDPLLLLIAVGVLLGGSFATFRTQRQCASAPGPLRPLWRAITGLTAGASLWSAHFLALLARDDLAGAAIDAAAALWSLVIGVALYSGLYAAANGRRSVRARVAAASALGPAAAWVHWLQLNALQVKDGGADLHLLALSALAGTAGGAAAAVAAGSGRDPRRVALCLALVCAGVVGVHVTAIPGEPTAAAPAPGLGASGQAVALVAAAAVMCVVVLALAAAQVAARSRSHALTNLQAALDALPAGVAVFDPNDRLLIWNQQYREQGGAVSSLLTRGRPFRALLEAGLKLGRYPEAAGREEAWLAERFEQRRRERDVEQQDGERWLRLQDRLTPDGGVVSIATDISELKRHAEVLAEARDRAEAANRAKDAFLANMSHELRTPLNGVGAVAEVLAQTSLNEQQQELVGLIQASSRTLTAVLSDVLDLARIEAGRLELTSEPLSPGDLLRETAGLWRAEAERKGLVLAADVDPSAEGAIRGDPVRLRQILGNLTSNAVKFTGSGGVRLRAWRESSSPDVLHLEVEDTGVGFEPDQAAALFERFRQADGSIVRRFGGTGLGLAICRELVDRMGGAIEAEGRPGAGAVFRVVLPAPVTEAFISAAAPPTRSSAPALSGRPLQVLLAEDHPVNRKVVEVILTSIGAGITSVENGAEAVDALRCGTFDVVLMDMQMPVMDGLSATRAIRAREWERRLEPTPIVMLTANAMPEHVAAALAAGADRHMAKPLSASDLLDVLAELSPGTLVDAA